jgi:hypothetical protein
VLLAAGLANEELVLRRAPGVVSGFDDQLAVGAEDTLTLAQRVLVELGDGKIAVNDRSLDVTRQRKNGAPPGSIRDGFSQSRDAPA